MPSSWPDVRLAEIAENVRAILRYTAGLDETAYRADQMRQDAVERCLLRISEAATKLGPVAEELAGGHDWAGIRGIGNVLRHAYNRIDPTIIWAVVSRDLPPLLKDVEVQLSRPETRQS